MAMAREGVETCEDMGVGTPEGDAVGVVLLDVRVMARVETAARGGICARDGAGTGAE